MSLASHHIYGSSRLGISSYWPLQYGNNWDYGNGVYDTLRLNQALPWYSRQYSDVIATGKTSPYGNGLMNTIVAQNLLGQKQYELTNHLGNVQATISDKRFPKDLNSDGQVDAFRAEVRAAYDYYPFGQLMPDRYVQDTARHCMLVSQTTMVTSTVSTITPWWGHWPSVPTWPGTGFTFGQIDNGISFTISGLNAFTQIPVSVDPGSSVFSFDVPTMYYAPLRMALTETIDGNDVLLASGVMSKTGTYNFNVTSQTGNLTLSFYDDQPHAQPVDNSLPYIWFTNSRWTHIVTTPQTTIVQICNGGKDAYEFGYNGKYKDNEIAGVGNSEDYGFRMYDNRLARFKSVDPLTKKYPMLTPYQFASNTPIQAIDLDGKEAWVVYKDHFLNSGKTTVNIIFDFQVQKEADYRIVERWIGKNNFAESIRTGSGYYTDQPTYFMTYTNVQVQGERKYELGLQYGEVGVESKFLGVGLKAAAGVNGNLAKFEYGESTGESTGTKFTGPDDQLKPHAGAGFGPLSIDVSRKFDGREGHGEFQGDILTEVNAGPLQMTIGEGDGPSFSVPIVDVGVAAGIGIKFGAKWEFSFFKNSMTLPKPGLFSGVKFPSSLKEIGTKEPNTNIQFNNAAPR